MTFDAFDPKRPQGGFRRFASARPLPTTQNPEGKRFVCRGSWVLVDGRHGYVGPLRVAKLAGLNPRECLLLEEGAENAASHLPEYVMGGDGALVVLERPARSDEVGEGNHAVDCESGAAQAPEGPGDPAGVHAGVPANASGEELLGGGSPAAGARSERFAVEDGGGDAQEAPGVPGLAAAPVGT